MDAVNRRSPAGFTRRLTADSCLRSRGTGGVLRGANRVGAHLWHRIGLLERASKFEMRALLGTLPEDDASGSATMGRPCALIYEGAACTSALSLVVRADDGITAIDVHTDERLLERAERLDLPADAVIGGGQLDDN